MIIIKSFIKILSLPLIIVMVLAGLILRLAAHISAYVVGPFLLFIVFCAGYSVIIQSWQDVFLLLLIGGAVFAAYFSSAILIGWTESAKSGLLAFLYS
ncbi:MAG: hypothetical protein IJI75_15230 [Solobacterium sp.]|nr:hypothetical protein [Solobacterium sp.]